MKRVILGALALLLLAPSAFAQGISQKVAVCDPAFTGRCLKPDASGNTPVTISGGSSTIGTVSPLVVTPTDRAGTTTTGGVAQTAIAANSARKGWCIQNPLTATENLQVRSAATATATTGISLAPGSEACNPPGTVDTGIISVLAATTAHNWFGTEYQ